MHSIDVSTLACSKHSSPYTDYGDNIEGCIQMHSSSLPPPLSHLYRLELDFPVSFQLGVDRWQSPGQWDTGRGPGRPAFCPFSFFLPETRKYLPTMTMKTTQRMVKVEDGGSLCLWQLRGAADLLTYWRQCFRAFYYLQLNVFLMASLIIVHIMPLVHNGKLSWILLLKHTFPVKHTVTVFLSTRNAPLLWKKKYIAFSVYLSFLFFEKKNFKIFFTTRKDHKC